MHPRPWCSFVFLCACLTSLSFNQPARQSISTPSLACIDTTIILSHTPLLADDLLEGRGVGSRGGDLAIKYIAAQFQALGLTPAGENGTFLQTFELMSTRTIGTPSLTFRSQSTSIGLRSLEDFTGGTRRYAHVQDRIELQDVEVVFVGYGIEAPHYQWDDYKGADLKGKLLLFLNNEPTTDDSTFFEGRKRLYTGRWTYKYEMAARKGAAGALIIHTDSSTEYGWNVVRSGASIDKFISPAQTVESFQYEGWLTEEAARRVLALAGHSFADLYQRAQRRDFRPIDLGIKAVASTQQSIRTVQTANVVGLLPGSDDAKRDEFVILMAHHDHLGIGLPVKGDSIYNGAIDNALGVGSMLAIARCYAAMSHGPRRSILFLASGAEEAGLLGAAYYATHPTVSPDRIAAAMNIDNANIWGPTKDVHFLGKGKTTLDPLLESIVRSHGRVVVSHPKPELGSFYRMDHLGFARVGIPALSFYGGYEHIGKTMEWGRNKHDEWEQIFYHQPCDQVDAWWNLEGQVENMRLVAEIVLAIANQEEMPDWVKGDEFAGVRAKMK